MSNFKPLSTLFVLLLFLHACTSNEAPSLTLPQWHTLTLSFEGPHTSEQASPNPFTDYILVVDFQQGERTYRIEGFYAADGNAAETQADTGNVWQVRFTPDQMGAWTYQARLYTGSNIAISDQPITGEEIPILDATGTFQVIDPVVNGRDFRGRGRLVVEDTYYKFRGTDTYFLKGGTDSPENFLAYADFDGTYRYSAAAREGEAAPKASLHQYEPHQGDWREGDPTWQGGKGKNMIGALNYLADQGMNSVYFLTMNIGGDGKDVWPYTDYEERQRFDCSKLDQWEIVFQHMEAKGLMMHVVLQETENETMLDDGDTGPLRKLYFRELIARFGHHLALTWNLGEENGPAHFSPDGQTAPQQRAMAAYFEAHDPYGHPVVIHTHAWGEPKDELLPPLLGAPGLDGLSMQESQTGNVHDEILRWKKQAQEAGHPWLVAMDEIGMWYKGVMPDSLDARHDTIRQQVLWGSLMAGAAGVEWYFGAHYAHNDLGCEDWRSRQNMWDQTRYALNFFQKIPYPQMSPANSLITEQDAYVLAIPGEAYAVYLPRGGNARIDLNGSSQNFTVQWYNPREGGEFKKGSVETIAAPGIQDLGVPPIDPTADWVVWVSSN